MLEGLQDATPGQIEAINQLMEQETHQAIIEGVQASQNEEKLRRDHENEENDRAAAEAAKDLIPDYET